MSSSSEVREQVCKALERFNALVSTKNLQVLAEFAPGDDVLLVGSDAGEIWRGRRELESFFVRIFARDTTYSWEWDGIDVFRAGDIAWFFAEAQIVLMTDNEQRKTSYRTSGVLERHGERWLWKQYHGSEPVIQQPSKITRHRSENGVQVL